MEEDEHLAASSGKGTSIPKGDAADQVANQGEDAVREAGKEVLDVGAPNPVARGLQRSSLQHPPSIQGQPVKRLSLPSHATRPRPQQLDSIAAEQPPKQSAESEQPPAKRAESEQPPAQSAESTLVARLVGRGLANEASSSLQEESAQRTRVEQVKELGSQRGSLEGPSSPPTQVPQSTELHVNTEGQEDKSAETPQPKADASMAPLPQSQHREDFRGRRIEESKVAGGAQGDPEMVRAALVLQRYVRLKNYRWFLLGRRGPSPVQLPPHPGDKRQIPVGAQPGRDPATAWHQSLQLALEGRAGAAEVGSSEEATVPDDDLTKKRATTALGYVSEVGRFAAAARAAAVLVIHEVMLHPYGMDTEKHRRHHLPQEEGQTVPRLISKDDVLWPLLRPRFDGDRVFVHDSMVLTVVGGSTHERSQEFAWRLYQHDLKGLQALADAMATSGCESPFSLPVAVLVDYLGFRVVCRPKVVALGDPPAELVLGPLAEAEVAYGAPGDLPELWREASNAAAAAQKEETINPTAYPGDSAESIWRQQLQLRSQSQFASLVLHEWDRRHPQLRSDLGQIAGMLGLQGYPVCLMSDLPKSLASTALLRLRCKHVSESERDEVEVQEAEELHFRSPAELMPPEILPDTDPSISRIVDPVKRLRREALWSLGVPSIPPTHAVTAAANSGQAGGSQALKELTSRAELELPQQLLERISSEGPPLDSQGWTDILHASGVNIRHMSRVAALASTSSAAALHREALARSAKWVLRRRLWEKKPWAPVAPQRSQEVHVGPERVATMEAVKLFNQALGSGAETVEFWDRELVPETTRRFGFESASLSRHRVKLHALFRAMEHHCRVKFASSAHRAHLNSPGYPEPFNEADLVSFESEALQPHFPHFAAVKDLWQQRLQQYHAVDEETRRLRDHLIKEPSFCGFLPDVRIICARGEEWSAAVSAPTRHTRDGRWDRVFQVLKLQLTFSRALGEAPAATGAILQGIAVALLEMAKKASKPVEDPDSVDEMAAEVMMKTGPTVDKTRLKQALWAADSATQMLPSLLSAWWAQLAAFEAEWLLDKHVEAHARLQRLQMEWERLSPDQPVLMLRLEGTAARLYAQQGNWSAAALHTEKCCNLAERAFGRAHPASVALRARLGDAWSRREDWDKATAAFQEAYSVAQVASDQRTTGRLAFELAQVLYWKGDLSGAKGFAEDAVKLLIPIEVGSSRSGDGPQLSTTSFEALMLLSQIYENLCRRLLELHDKEQAEIDPPMLQGLILKAVKCFETVLKNLPLAQQTPRRPGVLSRAAEIVESILGLKVMGMGDGEYTVLVDAVEELLLHASASTETAPALQRAIAQTRGVRQLQPRAETRAVAEAALRPVSSDSSRERPARLAALFESIAREALMSDVPPSVWFDQTVRLVAEGFSGAPEPGNVTYQATVQLLELCRYFGDAARIIMCATTIST